MINSTPAVSPTPLTLPQPSRLTVKRTVVIVVAALLMLACAPASVGSDATLVRLLNRMRSAPSLSSSLAQSGDGLGYSVAVSGNTVVIGAPYATGANGALDVGAAYIFVKTGNQWTDLHPIAKLTPSDPTTAEEFGISVAISGNTIVVGAWLDTVGPNHNQGAAYVFVMPGGGWQDMTQTAKLTTSDGQPDDIVGWSVAISGNTVFVGAPGVLDGRGAVYVFAEPPNGWENTGQIAELTASDGEEDDNLGTSVAVTGNTLAAGSPYANVNGLQCGAVYVYTQTGPEWRNGTQTAKLDASNPQYLSKLGWSVAIQNNTIIAGDYFGAPSGVYVFQKSGTSWQNSQQIAELTASGSVEYLGYSVAISGNTILAGAPGTRINGQEVGAAFIFVEPTNGWTNATQTAELTASSGVEGDDVGYSVALEGNTAIVGDPGANLVGKGLVFLNAAINWRNMTPLAILSE